MLSTTKDMCNSKWYLLRTTNKLHQEISLSLFGGLSQKEKTFSSIKREGEKAFRAGYSRLLLAWNFVFHKEKTAFLKWIAEQPQFFALSVHKKSFHDFKEMFKPVKAKNLLIDLQLEDYDNKLLKELENLPWPFQITIAAHKGVDLKQLVDSLSSRYKNNIESDTTSQNSTSIKQISTLKPNIHIHFPCYHKKHPQLYSSGEIYSFLKKDFYPPPYQDIYNLSIPEDLKLEPEKEPEFFYHVSGSNPIASVIIPTYNCTQELIYTLKHLHLQDLDKREWEVIVVDDGSEGNTATALKGLDFLSYINFKFIFLPRQYKRESFADHRFRAGIARNLGAKQAQGKFLLFLDSDILTPPCYISSTCKQLETEDVIQHPRYHLIKSAPKEYSKIDKNKHTFIKGNNYWENFYATAQDWNQKRLPWKYISTNTLCLKSSVFKKVGCFRKNYTCYGFEDTDLGYRLYQKGFRFKLNPIDTFHLYHTPEFLNSTALKHKLLGQSAKIFFHNNHSLEGYEEFRHFILNI